MTNKAGNTKHLLILTPLLGAFIFILLYITATLLYPGGSQADKNSKGFSWVNNYWCNLLNENAMNGQPNPGRPVALTGMFVLSVTLVVFWILFAKVMDFSRSFRIAIQVSAIVSMVTALFIFTSYHDVVIDIAGIAGLFALFATITGLYKNKWFCLFGLGFLNLLLIVVNNIIYYSMSLYCLPVVQKITFLAFLVWICLIDINLYHKQNRHKEF